MRSNILNEKKSGKKFNKVMIEKKTFDELGIMLDEDLSSLAVELESLREKSFGTKQDPHDVEVELAYVRREQQIRKIRRDRHEQYLKSQDQMVVDESDLPAGDFDNYSFVQLCAQRRSAVN